MIMNIKTIESSARSAVIALGLLAVLFFGSAVIVAGNTARDNDNNSEFYCQVIIPGNGGAMTKSEAPIGSCDILLVSVPVAIGGQSGEKYRPIQKQIYFKGFHNPYKIDNNLCSKVSSISSKKAREFTLVGAKPSGTG